MAIAANTTYVASYHTTSGVYSAEANYFNGSGFYNPPLRFLADGVDGPTGVYAYGAGGFPTLAGGSANYWVDVVYTTAPGFEIYAFDNTLTLGQSSVGNYDLGITGINGFFQAVTPTVSGLPPDTTGTFTPSVPPHPGPFALVVTTGAERSPRNLPVGSIRCQRWHCCFRHRHVVLDHYRNP